MRKDIIDQEVKQLFITYKRPYKAASINTLRRWVKNIFQETNIYNFSPHICRVASTSKRNMLNLDISEILKRGSWKNAKTFYQFYNKQIIPYNVNELQNLKKKLYLWIYILYNTILLMHRLVFF